MKIISRLPPLLTLVCAAGCARAPALLLSEGQPGKNEARLGWITMVIALIVVVVVAALLLVATFRRRRATDPNAITREGNGINWILTGGVITPVIVLIPVFVLVLSTLQSTAQPPKTNLAGTFQIIGHRWWWEVQRVNVSGRTQFVTANEIHIPVGRPVRLKLSSADVIHSFWVPELAGKTDVIPGQVNDAWIQADKPGVYFAHCAEYCGMQHSHMAMQVVAESDEAFQRWLARQETDASGPRTADQMRGREVFLGAPCASCHQIRGTPAAAIVGPDLTHIGSRRTLAAGALPNSPGNLAGWIANSQTIKPGNDMPAMYLNAADLHALVEYLESLK